MKFIPRAFTGIALGLITLGLIGTAGWRLHSAVSGATKKQRPPARERIYAVDVGTLSPARISPTITAYGQIQTWNSLEIRAPAAGPIIEISSNFRDGLTVAVGELLFRIDPELSERRVIDAKAALAQANFELSEATLSLSHVEAELRSAKAQIAVRASDLARKSSLFVKKLTTSTVVDDATLALSASRQATFAKQQAVLAAKSRIDKSKASVERAQLTLKDARQTLSETSYRAPYSGRFTDVSATVGRRVSANEKLGVLIDPKALEVSFQVRNGDFGQLLDPSATNKLARLPVKVLLDLSGKTIAVDGVLDRTAAVAGGQAGQTVYAKLNAAHSTVLRPGDFVTVEITEPVLSGVAVIPTAAATNDGRILLVNKSGRLSEHEASIIRRQGDKLVVGAVPFGRQFVRLRLPFLAPGIKVKPRNTIMPATAQAPSRPSTKSEDGVAIDEAKRAALIKLVKASSGMSQDRQTRMLEELAKAKPSRRIVERLERRLSHRGNRS